MLLNYYWALFSAYTKKLRRTARISKSIREPEIMSESMKPNHELTANIFR